MAKGWKAKILKKRKLVRTTRFWNNLHQVFSMSKDWKAKYIKSFGAWKPKGLNMIAKTQLRSHMYEGGKP
jgi:hypothetical protein